MNRTQKYISTLLERLPKWELRSYEHQTSLDKIRDRLSSSHDLKAELRSLYQVKGFSDFALSLLWIVDKVEKDPLLEESTLKEETFVFLKFRQGVGDQPDADEANPDVSLNGFSSTEGSEFDDMTGQSSGMEPLPAAEPYVDEGWADAFQSQAVSDNHEPTIKKAAAPVMNTDQEKDFSHSLDQLLEAVQSGNDDRSDLLTDLIHRCDSIAASGNAAEDLKEFCVLLVDFLNYVSENQFLDDIRVMNIVSNIQSPVTQWVQTDAANRTGILNPATDILRDYKTMFE
jgi:hypothetical protein